MKKLILVLAALLTFTRVFAVEDTPANRAKEADSYFNAIAMKDLISGMTDSTAKSLPLEKRAAFRDMMGKYFDWDAVEKAIKASMIKNFTADELHALAEFYGSPIAKSALKKLPRYMADVMPTIQGETVKAMSRANQEKPDLMTKPTDSDRYRDPNATPKPTSGTPERKMI